MFQRVLPVEIPIPMDRLRVSTEEEDLDSNVLQNITIDSFSNIPNYLSPSASPDELVIRQRGKMSH